MPLADLVYTGIPLGDPANIAGYIGTPLNKRSWNCPTLECHWGDYNSPHTIQAHIVKQSSIHASLKWQDGGTQGTSGQISVNSAFTWSLLLSTVYQFCSSNMWLVQHHFVHAWDISTIIAFVYFGLQYKWNQLSSNNSRHTSCIHRGLHAGKWPDPMTSKPDAPSSLGVPLGRLHWNHTGWCYRPSVFQWQSNVNLHNWNTLEYRWGHTYTGMPKEPHWPMSAPSGNSVLIRIIETHWITTGRPLEAHWKHTDYQQFFLQSYSSVHWGLSSRHTELPLDCHWITSGLR